MKIVIAINVDEYIALFPKNVQQLLNQLRKTIKTAAPKADEIISYGMPGYKQNGMLVYFAAYKNHIGFYGTPQGHKAFEKELAIYKSGKGSVQFPLDKPLPLKVITKIVQFRILKNEEGAAKKKSAKPAANKTTAAKSTDQKQVKAWINKLEPAVKKEIEAVQKIIKASSSKLSERIKWNAPSYFYKEDIVTFGPYKANKLLLIFHHPAVVKVKSELLEGNYKDRRLVYFKDKADAEKNKKELAKIIIEIIKVIDKK